MALQSNMDHSKETKSNIPQLELTLHNNDMNGTIPKIGDRGSISFDAECVGLTHEGASFRKCGGPAKLSNFSQRNLEDMENDLGEAPEPEDRPKNGNITRYHSSDHI